MHLPVCCLSAPNLYLPLQVVKVLPDTHVSDPIPSLPPSCCPSGAAHILSSPNYFQARCETSDVSREYPLIQAQLESVKDHICSLGCVDSSNMVGRTPHAQCLCMTYPLVGAEVHSSVRTRVFAQYVHSSSLKECWSIILLVHGVLFLSCIPHDDDVRSACA